MNKENIINSYSKNDFQNFLSFDSSGQILELFDEEGICIIEESHLKEERICYILTYSPYKNELLQNTSFLDMFLDSNISNYYAVLKNLNYNTYDFMLKRSIELNKDPMIIAKLFSYFNVEYKLNKIDNWIYSEELLYDILKSDEQSVVRKIIDKHNIDLSSHNINLRNFFSNAKESVLIAQAKRNTENIIIVDIQIPPTMITKELAEKIWNKYDIFGVRAIINDAEYCTDASLLNNYVKYKEDQIIKNYNFSSFLSPFQEIYNAFKNYKLEELRLNKGIVQDNENYYKHRNEYLQLVRKLDIENFHNNLENLYNENSFEAVEAYLKKLSDNSLSNYIIDYHFEENYHNVMLDIRELLNFYYNGYISIPIDRVELYDKISNIDYLASEEKIELHEYLKNFNMIETFYDDMSIARYIVAETIKEYSLSSQSLKEYKDEELSKKYGVDVYTFDGNPFFGIVKTGSHEKDKLPTGHSYSLIGNGGIAVCGDPKSSNTFLYDSDDMNPEQLVHAFPFDSFTYYHPFEYSANSTRKTNILAMPEELVETSISYNELLILEKGKSKTDIDTSIPELKRIALYCLDEIREQDIEIAKNNNVGIMLINSSKYKPLSNGHLYTYHHSISNFDNNYFDGFFEKDKFEARR